MESLESEDGDLGSTVLFYYSIKSRIFCLTGINQRLWFSSVYDSCGSLPAGHSETAATLSSFLFWFNITTIGLSTQSKQWQGIKQPFFFFYLALVPEEATPTYFCSRNQAVLKHIRNKGVNKQGLWMFWWHGCTYTCSRIWGHFSQMSNKL